MAPPRGGGGAAGRPLRRPPLQAAGPQLVFRRRGHLRGEPPPRPPARGGGAARGAPPLQARRRGREDRLVVAAADARRREGRDLGPAPTVLAPNASGKAGARSPSRTRRRGPSPARRRPAAPAPPSPAARRGVVDERPEEVLLDRPQRGGAQVQDLGDRLQVALEEGDVGRLAGDVGGAQQRPTPRSACASAGASLMPSPTNATFRPSAWSWATISALRSGRISRTRGRRGCPPPSPAPAPGRRRRPRPCGRGSPARRAPGRPPPPRAGALVERDEAQERRPEAERQRAAQARHRAVREHDAEAISHAGEPSRAVRPWYCAATPAPRSSRQSWTAIRAAAREVRGQAPAQRVGAGLRQRAGQGGELGFRHPWNSTVRTVGSASVRVPVLSKSKVSIRPHFSRAAASRKRTRAGRRRSRRPAARRAWPAPSRTGRR